jgi:hypothetical protein
MRRPAGRCMEGGCCRAEAVRDPHGVLPLGRCAICTAVTRRAKPSRGDEATLDVTGRNFLLLVPSPNASFKAGRLI